MHAKSLQLCLTLWDPIDCSPPAPLSMGFSRQEYWSGLLCPSPGDLLNPGIKPAFLMSPALVGLFFTISATWEAQFNHHFSSVTQSCSTLCDPMNHSMPGLRVHHQLPESPQTHVHWVSDAIQPSHPLLSPSPPAPSIRVFSNESALRIRWPKYWSLSFTSVLPMNTHLGWTPLGRTGWISLQSKGLSRVFSNTTV